MQRRGELADGLLPAKDMAEIAVSVGNMFNAFPMVKVPGEQFKAVLVAYVEQLKQFPIWAIEAGCKTAASRNAPFPPNAGELRAICDGLLQPIREEEAAIRKVLDAEIYTPNSPGERERVKAGFQSLLAELRQTNSMDKAKAKPTFTRPKLGTPTTLSDETLAKFAAKYADKPLTDAAE